MSITCKEVVWRLLGCADIKKKLKRFKSESLVVVFFAEHITFCSSVIESSPATFAAEVFLFQSHSCDPLFSIMSSCSCLLSMTSLVYLPRSRLVVGIHVLSPSCLKAVSYTHLCNEELILWTGADMSITTSGDASHKTVTETQNTLV